MSIKDSVHKYNMPVEYINAMVRYCDIVNSLKTGTNAIELISEYRREALDMDAVGAAHALQRETYIFLNLSPEEQVSAIKEIINSPHISFSSTDEEFLIHYNKVKQNNIYKCVNKLIDNGLPNIFFNSIASYDGDTTYKINEGVITEYKFDLCAVNKLFIGPPGTGKSYEINQELQNVDKSLYERITFYQDYDNSDFVGSILPVMINDVIDYKFVAGPVTRMIKKAINNPNVMHYLIIEEMSRGNCGAIFGDIFQLLDRNDNHESMYGISNHLMEKEIYGTTGITQIIVPNNLTIYGTVNSSDQNVFPMDTAFMRRFNQKYISTDLADLKLKDNVLNIEVYDLHWIDLYPLLNEYIIHRDYCGLSEDKQIGPFFITSKDEGYLTKLFRYIHHDIDRISNGNTIIDQDINGFANVIKEVEKGNNVFSKDFIDFMNNYGK